MDATPPIGMAVRSTPGERGRAAAVLWTSSIVSLAALPLGMAVLHRSSPLFLTVSAACALAAVLVEGRGDDLVAAIRRSLWTPLGAAALAFLGWAALSIAWSGAPATSGRAFGELLLPCAGALLLAVSLPGRVPDRALWLLAGAMVLGCVSMLIEIRTGLALRRILGVRWSAYIFNRPVVTMVLLLAPLVCGLAWASPRRRAVLTLAGVVAVALIAALSESGAAVLGLAVLAGTALLAWVFPRPTVALAAAALVAAVASGPVVGEIAERVMWPAVHSELSGSHSRDRVDIWRSFGASIRGAPLVGEGFGSSAKLQAAAIAPTVPPEFRPMLAAGHPHSAAVQVWTELGVVGATLALIVLLLVLRKLATFPGRGFAPALALFAAVGAVSLVGHGAWQGWWAASIGASIVWLRIAGRQGHAP